jgi:protein-glutamine gamma-glutamyltransferase
MQPAAERAPPGALGWVSAAFAGGVLLHLDRVPAWASAAALILIAWRLVAASGAVRLPGGWLRAGLALAAVAAVYARFRTLNGLAPGTALLVLMAALKLLETRVRRDQLVVLGASLFLLLAACLDRQSLPRAPLYVLEVWLCCAALALTATPGFRAREAIGLAGRTLLLAAPLALLMFVFFPRVAGSFWAVPLGEAAVTGLSDTMSPGSIAHLIASYDVAFRVQFMGAAPPYPERYWRGPVLHDFDGHTWRSAPQLYRRRAPLEASGPLYRYRVELEPTRQRWWFALDTPLQSPDPKVTLTYDSQLVARAPVTGPTTFEAESRHPMQPLTPLSAADRFRDTLLPPGENPRTAQLARDLRRRAASDRALVQAALDLLRTGGFTYSLDPVPLAADQIDDFLFNTRSGFCEHYASAFVALLRAAGVPARVVTGYLGGEFNPIGGYYVVRQSDAHSWAEVWLEGGGWTRVDPTAVVEPERMRRGLLDLLPGAASAQERLLRGSPWLVRLLQRWDATNSWWDERVVRFDYAAQLDLLERLGVRSPGTREVGWALALALLGWLAVIAWHFGSRSRRARPDALARAYRRLCGKLARQGGVVRAAHQGPLDYARAYAARHPGPDGGALALLARYAELRYGAADPQRRERELSEFTRAVRRLRVR